MNRIDVYMEEHSTHRLTLVRESSSLWKATVMKENDSSKLLKGKNWTVIAIGRGAKPSAALSDLDRKLAMFAH